MALVGQVLEPRHQRPLDRTADRELAGVGVDLHRSQQANLHGNPSVSALTSDPKRHQSPANAPRATIAT